MDARLAKLIHDYQKAVESTLALMRRSGISMPCGSSQWIESDIPGSGRLIDGSEYYKHGAGCGVCFSSGTIDFDFGAQGECNVFDAWRLVVFSKNRLLEYGFLSDSEVYKCFDEAVGESTLLPLDFDLYYVAGTPRLYATDVEFRDHDDLLPNRNHDPVLTLYAHYFLAADLMRKNYEKLNGKWSKDGGLNQDEGVDFRIYFSSWLGFLAVTCEGFKGLSVRVLLTQNRPKMFADLTVFADPIGRLMKQHADTLREFRNTVFHLRENLAAARSFFAPDANRLSWSIELHDAFERFFREYRVLCEVHYLLHERKGDITLFKKQKRKKLKSN
ncbi:DUF6896 domain-containing protein [Pseudomonas citronellolis]|uniref:DUF6896 domain-containing protein n=2 Tax=Pseudomonas citronellolis TaxID=53408 RepID=UPI0022BA1799|nr:hypothetical protein [Pseudomonas citronellolis]